MSSNIGKISHALITPWVEELKNQLSARTMKVILDIKTKDDEKANRLDKEKLQDQAKDNKQTSA